jgi:hypothetical protein
VSEPDLDTLLYQLLEGETDREHGEALLGMYENATERRQEQDQALLEMLRRAQQTEVEKAEQE